MLQGSTPSATVLSASTPITVGANSPAIQVGNYKGFVAYLNVSVLSGTASPTLNIKFQDSPDGVTFYDVPSAAFTAVTTVSTQRLVVSPVGDFIRVVSTVTGTTPSFTTSLQIAGVM